MTKIIINGCNGRMGQVVANMAAADPDFTVVAGVDKFPSTIKNPFPVFKDIMECDVDADVLIDFSRPDALPGILEYAQDHNVGLVIATTGLSEDHHELLQRYVKRVPIFISANMSLGVNLMIDLVQKAASALGESFDIEIIEKHHNQKVDSPSGTALALANAINKVFLNSKNYVYGRKTTNERRSNTEIGIHAVRGGTIVGEHQVLFIGKDEVLEVNHIAQSKQIFAVGALRAAKFIKGKPPMLYNMQDILLEQDTVTNVYTDNDQVMVTINNVPHSPRLIASIFDKIAAQHVSIDMISQTSPVHDNIDISFTLHSSDMNKVVEILHDFERSIPDMKIDICTSITKITVEGTGMERQAGVAAKLFNILAEQDIKVMIITTSETKISYIIHQQDERLAVEAIIRSFGL